MTYLVSMSRRIFVPSPIDRLLFALLIAIALILSQVVHAKVPAPNAGAVPSVPAAFAMSHASSGADAVDYHSSGPTAGHADGEPDMQCAGHCPASVILASAEPPERDGRSGSSIGTDMPSLVGIPFPAAERPPKA